MTEGMQVLIPFSRKKGKPLAEVPIWPGYGPKASSQEEFERLCIQWLPCVVTCATGDHARVENELHKVGRWYHLNNLRSA